MRFFVLPLFLIGFVSFSQDEIKLDPQPDNIPDTESGWNEKMSESLNNLSFEEFIRDQNYALSNYALQFGSYKKTLFASLMSDEVMASLYKWILPGIKQKWVTLSLFEKAEVKAAILHCLNYISEFDLSKEEAYLTALTERNRIGNYVQGKTHPWTIHYRHMFCRYAPSDYFNGDCDKPYPWECKSPYRRLEAFIYRRAKDGIKPELIAKYLKKLNSDLILKEGKLTDKTDTYEQSGSIKNGLRDGKWTEKKLSNEGNWVTTFEGTYADGKLNGPVERKYVYSWTDDISEGNEIWKNGQLKTYSFTSIYRGKPNSKDAFDMDKRYRRVDNFYRGTTQEYHFDKEYYWTYPSIKDANKFPGDVRALKISKNLTTLPDFSKYPNLEVLDLSEAEELSCFDLPKALSKNKNIKKIVLTGQPCSEETKSKLKKIYSGLKLVE